MTHKCQKQLVNCSKRSIVRKQQDRWRCSTLDKLPLGDGKYNGGMEE